MPVQSQVVIVVNYRDRTMGIYYLNPAGFAQTWYLAHLAHVWHRQHITANPHPRPVKTQFVIVLNYRDQTMVINHLNHAGLLQEWHVRPCPHRQHVSHRQHLTAYPHARPVRRQGLWWWTTGIRLCEFGTSYSKATCATQAARNCIPAWSQHAWKTSLGVINMPTQSQVVIVVNYRDRTMGIYYLNYAWLVQPWRLRPILKDNMCDTGST